LGFGLTGNATDKERVSNFSAFVISTVSVSTTQRQLQTDENKNEEKSLSELSVLPPGIPS
jgi:hypothetical protein